jgi:hypothetical protein
MTPAAAAPTDPSPTRGSGRVQGAAVIAALLASVVATVLLVAAPASSSARSTGARSPAIGLPAGLQVEVRGGEPMVAYGVADRLADAGASVEAVHPESDRGAGVASTMIVYYDLRSMGAAESVRSLLGRGTLRRQQVFEPDVDITIVLGKDLANL